jgi:hypothetical protein
MRDPHSWLSLAQAHKVAVEKLGGRETAELLLANALRCRKISARGEFYIGEDYRRGVKLTPDFWFDRENIDWLESRIVQRLPRLKTRDEEPNYLRLGSFYRIQLKIKDLNKLWPELLVSTINNSASNHTALTQSQVSCDKGGRPPKYDWEGATIAMARVAVLGQDSSQAALARAVRDWFARKGEEPSDSLIRAKVKRFHESIWPPKT